MARVIKGGTGQKPARPAARVHIDAGSKKFIERAVYQAKQDAEHILMRAEQERQDLVADGKKRAARAKEEAMARGASEAFASAASEALTAFRKRAERYGEASDDVRVLALEVVKKILGADPDLGPARVDKILQHGIAQLRARRRLRLQVSYQRLGELASERPNLMKALQSEPDLVIESVDDVSTGFARVVTEIGGALCAEDTALDALSMAVNVREQPRERGGRQGTGATAVSDGPSGLHSLRRGGVRTPLRGESLPAVAAAVLDEAHAQDDTLNFPLSAQRADDVEEIMADEDSDAAQARPDVHKDEDLDLFTDAAPRKRR